ncbi:hypothetical protein [Nocardia sp. NRRL WC-3656]|uniref:hypothetical protein n=1 Tax=Nocardia sp. NRRL WC-3656 TaxID=1463824 RepID=UPI0012DC2C67|nr:hypothetical protein [Nocardia sp. NRRL WC-3656]
MVNITGSRYRYLEYAPIYPGPCAIDLPHSRVGAKMRFFDCLLLKLLIAPGDDCLVGSAVRSVQRVISMQEVGYVILDGYIELPASPNYGGKVPDVLAALSGGLDILHEFADRVEERGNLVHLIPFGWRKDMVTQEYIHFDSDFLIFSEGGSKEVADVDFIRMGPVDSDYRR